MEEQSIILMLILILGISIYLNINCIRKHGSFDDYFSDSQKLWDIRMGNLTEEEFRKYIHTTLNTYGYYCDELTFRTHEDIAVLLNRNAV